MLQARSGLCMYRTAYYFARMRSCYTGELCVVFVCGSRSSCNLFLFYTLCTEFTMFRFASHIFFCCTLYGTFWPRVCSVLIQLWVVFDSSCFDLHLLLLCFFLFVILLLCQYSVVSTLSYRCTCTLFCVVSMLFLCFGWCLCIFGEAIVFFSCDCFLMSLSLYCER